MISTHPIATLQFLSELYQNTASSFVIGSSFDQYILTTIKDFANNINHTSNGSKANKAKKNKKNDNNNNRESTNSREKQLILWKAMDCVSFLQSNPEQIIKELNSLFTLLTQKDDIKNESGIYCLLSICFINLL